MPSPAITRPGASSSRATNSDTRTGPGTRPTRATVVPTQTRSVVDATAASSGNGAMAGRSGWPMGHRWSKQNTPSIPASSAWRATSSASVGSSRKLGRMTPVFTG